jgi:hypothetical protein
MMLSTSSCHRAPAAGPAEAPAAATQRTVDIALHERQRACAGGIDHQAIGRHRHQDALALRAERRHEVVRIGQLIQPRVQLLVAGVGLDEALRVRAHLGQAVAGGRPATGTGRERSSHGWPPGAVRPLLPRRSASQRRTSSANACSRWRASRSSNGSVHNSGITVVPVAGRRASSRCCACSRDSGTGHMREAHHTTMASTSRPRGPAQSAQNLQHSFPSMARCRSRSPA